MDHQISQLAYGPVTWNSVSLNIRNLLQHGTERQGNWDRTGKEQIHRPYLTLTWAPFLSTAKIPVLFRFLFFLSLPLLFFLEVLYVVPATIAIGHLYLCLLNMFLCHLRTCPMKERTMSLLMYCFISATSTEPRKSRIRLYEMNG